MRFTQNGGYPHERTCSCFSHIQAHMFAPSSPKRRLTGSLAANFDKSKWMLPLHFASKMTLNHMAYDTDATFSFGDAI